MPPETTQLPGTGLLYQAEHSGEARQATGMASRGPKDVSGDEVPADPDDHLGRRPGTPTACPTQRWKFPQLRDRRGQEREGTFPVITSDSVSWIFLSLLPASTLPSLSPVAFSQCFQAAAPSLMLCQQEPATRSLSLLLDKCLHSGVSYSTSIVPLVQFIR